MRFRAVGSVSMDDTKLLDAALQMLVDFELESPCDTLPDIDDKCAETCKYKLSTKRMLAALFGVYSKGGMTYRLWRLPV